MNPLSLVVLFVAVAAASAGHWGGHLVGPSNPGATLKGPAAHATVHGPDGSVNGGAADAGALIAGPTHGGAISAAVAPGHVALGHGGWGVGALGWGHGWGHGGAALVAPAAHGVVVPGWGGHWGGLGHGLGHGWGHGW